jgi:hypothetical protein
MTLWEQITDDQRETIVATVVQALARSDVPHHLRAGLVRYFSDGILPGGFTQAVLCNDLKQAVGRADPYSTAGLATLVTFLMEHVPARAWGSKAKVLAWTTTPDRLEV